MVRIALGLHLVLHEAIDFVERNPPLWTKRDIGRNPGRSTALGMLPLHSRTQLVFQQSIRQRTQMSIILDRNDGRLGSEEWLLFAKSEDLLSERDSVVRATFSL